MTTARPLIPRRRFVQLGASTAALAAARGAVQQADVLVVGAGASGCNAAWHLQQAGRSVTVLEAAPAPASQASKGAAGFVANWSAIHIPEWGELEWRMQQYAIDFYTKLAKECGEDIGFGRVGLAYIYLHAEAWQKLQPRIQTARKLGTRLELLNARRAAEVLPFINFKSTAGIAFDPDSIRISAADAIPCMARVLAKRGVRFHFNTPVRGFVHEGEKVVGVKTDSTEFRAASIVVTAGAWSRPLLEKAGARCPTTAEAETRYTTRPIAGVPANMPMLIFSDAENVYIREERGGMLIGGGDPTPAPKDRLVDPSNPPTVDHIPQVQAYRSREFIRKLEPVMPLLKQGEVDQIAGGVPTYTSDYHFIADAVPRHAGLYVITGCQEAGVTHGPGLGRIIAELITKGRSTWDHSPYKLDRFKG